MTIKHFFIPGKTVTTLRSEKIYRHTLGTDTNNDALVYFEKDDTYSVSSIKKNQRNILL